MSNSLVDSNGFVFDHNKAPQFKATSIIKSEIVGEDPTGKNMYVYDHYSWATCFCILLSNQWTTSCVYTSHQDCRLSTLCKKLSEMRLDIIILYIKNCYVPIVQCISRILYFSTAYYFFALVKSTLASKISV